MQAKVLLCALIAQILNNPGWTGHELYLDSAVWIGNV